MSNAAGTCAVTASKEEDNDYLAATSQPVMVTLTRATQSTLVVNAPASLTYGSTATLTITGGGGSGALTFTAGASTGCALAGAVLSVIDASGSCSVTATKQGDANYNGPVASAPATVTLLKAPQTISFAPLPNARVADSPLTVSATASSGLVVTFTTTTPTVCTSGGTNGATITILVSGVCTVVAHQTGNSNYLAAPGVPQSFTAGSGKLDQTITFAALSSRTVIQTPFTVSAAASSGLAVTFMTTTSAVCTASGTNGATISLLAAGTCSITANQAGNATYNPAPAVVQTFLVTKADQTITFAPLPNKPDGSRFTVSATASSGLPVTFSTTTPTICTATGGRYNTTIRLLSTGTCTVQGDQGGDARYNAAPPVRQSFAVTP